MRASIVIAGVLAIGAGAWIASGQFDKGSKTANANGAAVETPAPAAPLVSVRIRKTFAAARQREIIINGRTEESRRVTLRAATAGPIDSVPVKEGRMLKRGDIVTRLNVEDRTALLAEAEALVKQREIEYKAASRLAKKGFRSDTKLAESRAQLDAARARTKSMRIDISRTKIRAPFDGVLEDRYVETGDYVKVGDEIATIVDLDPVLAVGFVSERDITEVKVGAKASVELVDGRWAEGIIRYVATVADSETRSFRTEVEIANRDGNIRAGLTGRLRIPLSTIMSHLISPSILTLADDGRVGVRIVNADDVVEFIPVRILSNSNEGLWVSGLENGHRLITVGHEFVKSGQKVRAVPETVETAS